MTLQISLKCQFFDPPKKKKMDAIECNRIYSFCEAVILCKEDENILPEHVIYKRILYEASLYIGKRIEISFIRFVESKIYCKT